MLGKLSLGSIIKSLTENYKSFNYQVLTGINDMSVDAARQCVCRLHLNFPHFIKLETN